jgi:parallel beta-helix repeat protein
MKLRWMDALMTFGLTTLFISPAQAIDGQVDIATLPYTINEPGSYVVVADLHLGEPDQNGIEIVVSDVTLDLNGHSLSGPGQSVGGLGSGVSIADGVRNVTIRNGRIGNWRGDGVQGEGAIGCRVHWITVSVNGEWGIILGDLSSIEGCTAEINGAGIYTGSNAVVLHTQSVGSLNEGGIQAGDSCQILDNVCGQNLLTGINVGANCNVVGNVCTANGQEGIVTFRKCRIEGNGCDNNGGDGIRVDGAGCVIRENLVSTNGGDGIQVLNNADVVGNRVTNNGRIDPEGVGIRVTGIRNNIRENNGRGGLYGLALEGERNIVADNRLSGTAGAFTSVPNNRLDIVIETLPFTILWPGVYRIAGSLSTDDPSTAGISIQSGEVTLDLGGHALIGPGKVGPSLSTGILVSAASHNVVIRNGTVQDWPGFGVAGPSHNNQYENLRCSRNGLTGLVSGSAALLSEISAEENGSDGFEISAGSIATHCTAYYNGRDGFYVAGSILNDCASSYNGDSGVNAYSGARIMSCLCQSNGEAGIVAYSNITVRGNTCVYNSQDGIRAAINCRIVENTCTSNALQSAGIRVEGGGSVVEGNVVSNNSVGILCNPFTGNYFASNRANGNATNYDIVPGNTQGAGDLANVSF